MPFRPSTVCLVLCVVIATLALASCRTERPAEPAAATPAGVTIAAALPADVPGGAENASLRAGAEYAWQQFIALNWPAKAGERDRPDPARRFGEPGGPVVWETFRTKAEIFPANGSATVVPPGYERGAPDYGYDEHPVYVYEVPIPPCATANAAVTTPWVNLDEISQVGFDHMFAGAAGGPDDAARQIRFTAKANRTYYQYIAANQFWFNTSPSYVAATTNFTNAVNSGEFPPKGPWVNFPEGTMEAKAAFRRLTPKERAGGRFHVTRVRYYESASDDGSNPCHHDEEWGLIGLHIIQKTKSAPAFTWATFEHADNILTAAGEAVEDANGNVVRAAAEPTTPALSYQDGAFEAGKMPLVQTVPKDAVCSDPGARLYYRELAGNTNIPVGGAICVNGRMHPIPKTIVDVNQAAHEAIAAYERTHGLQSPWRYYKLVNVQLQPFDKNDISADNESGRGRSTYFTSNIVVETDYTLQNHSGGPEPRTGGAPSDLASNFPPEQPPPLPAYQNTYVMNGDGTLRARYNMGGCTGCHGLTQVRAGTDYSYILFNSSVKLPESTKTPPAVLRARYISRLAPP
jgi:hypothetical protein